MNSLLLRLAYSRFTTISLGLVIPLVLIHRGVDSEVFASYKSLEYLPYVVVGLLAGAVIDAYGAPRILRWGMVAHIVPPLITAGVMHDLLPLSWFYIALLMLSAASYVVSSGLSRAAMDTVNKDQLVSYNARTTLIDQVASLVLPVGIGWLASFSLDAALGSLVILSCLAISMLHLDGYIPTPPKVGWFKSVGVKIVSGIKAMGANRFLLQLSLIVMLINAVEIMPGTLLVFYASIELQVDATHIGALVAAGGLGGVIAALAVERLSGNIQTLFVYLVVSMIVNAAIYLTVYYYNNYVALMASLAVESASVVVSMVAFRTLRQISAGKESYGVVLGVSGAFVKLAIPPAVLFGGFVASRYGVRSVYFISGLFELILAFPVAIWAVGALEVLRYES
jgi:MFS transporter, DHA3 family, macrolide efflux protein